jgi:acyl-CoA synthetase (AMP-forming)/AMP-acid ligase II
MSLVRARRNAITGAVVTADVVLAEGAGDGAGPPAADVLTRALTEACRARLPAYKIPAMIRIVPALEVSASGKLVRPGA